MNTARQEEGEKLSKFGTVSFTRFQRSRFLAFLIGVLGFLGATAAHSATSNLALGMSAARSPASVNELITWHLSVTNLGPNTANSVVITNWIPAAATFFSATVSQGSYT